MTIYNEDYGLGGVHHRTLCKYKVLRVEGNTVLIEPLEPSKDSKATWFPTEFLESNGFVDADANLSEDQYKAIADLLIDPEEV